MKTLRWLIFSLTLAQPVRAEELVSEVLSASWDREMFGGPPPLAEFKVPSLSPGPVYDASAFLSQRLLPISPKGIALYAPAAKRLFIRDTPQQLETYRTLLTGDCGPVMVSVKIEVAALNPVAKAPAAVIECLSHSGYTYVAKWGEKAENFVQLTPVVQPDGNLVGCELKMKFAREGTEYELETLVYVQAGKRSNLLGLKVTKGGQLSNGELASALAVRLLAKVQPLEPDRSELLKEQASVAKKVEQELADAASAKAK